MFIFVSMGQWISIKDLDFQILIIQAKVNIVLFWARCKWKIINMIFLKIMFHCINLQWITKPLGEITLVNSPYIVVRKMPVFSCWDYLVGLTKGNCQFEFIFVLKIKCGLHWDRNSGLNLSYGNHLHLAKLHGYFSFKFMLFCL